MADAFDVTQSPEYLELFKVSEEMEADFTQQLAAKDALIAQKEQDSQAKIAELQESLDNRDKEVESYLAELDAANQAALRAKDEEAAVLKRALAEAEAQLQQGNSTAAVRTPPRVTCNAHLTSAVQDGSNGQMQAVQAKLKDAEDLVASKDAELLELRVRSRVLVPATANTAVAGHCSRG